MTMENSGHEETSQGADTTRPATDAHVPNPSRRRFNRAGVGASAVLLTLASRSVLAQGACTSPSGFHSANMSGGGPVQPRCSGLTPEGWRERGVAEEVPALKLMVTSGFFPVSPALSAGKPTKGRSATSRPGKGKDKDKTEGASTDNDTVKLADATFFEALAGDETHDVIKHLIAAHLNFKQGLNDFPTDIETNRIYQEWVAKSTYTPTAGVIWDGTAIIKYLRATQTYIPVPKA